MLYRLWRFPNAIPNMLWGQRLILVLMGPLVRAITTNGGVNIKRKVSMCLTDLGNLLDDPSAPLQRSCPDAAPDCRLGRFWVSVRLVGPFRNLR